MNQYLLNNSIHFDGSYLLDIDLSGGQCYPPFEQLGPGACFTKVPKLFERILGHIILFVSSKHRRLEAGNFAVISICIPFTTYKKTSFYEWLFGPKKVFGTFEKRAPGLRWINFSDQIGLRVIKASFLEEGCNAELIYISILL